jgi:hypothetical protein
MERHTHFLVYFLSILKNEIGEDVVRDCARKAYAKTFGEEFPEEKIGMIRCPNGSYCTILCHCLPCSSYPQCPIA